MALLRLPRSNRLQQHLQALLGAGKQACADRFSVERAQLLGVAAANGAVDSQVARDFLPRLAWRRSRIPTTSPAAKQSPRWRAPTAGCCVCRDATVFRRGEFSGKRCCARCQPRSGCCASGPVLKPGGRLLLALEQSERRRRCSNPPPSSWPALRRARESVRRPWRANPHMGAPARELFGGRLPRRGHFAHGVTTARWPPPVFVELLLAPQWRGVPIDADLASRKFCATGME